ncbi:MAG: amino acid-binding protein [Clostridiales bacterium]|nr:amino acid-binding protein [Clostridiales bacterium]
MYIKQISIFLPNQKGHLEKVTRLFLKHNIDIRAIVAFDTAEYGILRTIVDQPDKAVKVLNEEGFVAKISKVIVVEPEDRTGSLHELFEILANNDFNVEYTYSFVMRQDLMPFFVLKINELEKAARVLCENGIKVINIKEILPD